MSKTKIYISISHFTAHDPDGFLSDKYDNDIKSYIIRELSKEYPTADINVSVDSINDRIGWIPRPEILVSWGDDVLNDPEFDDDSFKWFLRGHVGDACQDFTEVSQWSENYYAPGKAPRVAIELKKRGYVLSIGPADGYRWRNIVRKPGCDENIFVGRTINDVSEWLQLTAN